MVNEFELRKQFAKTIEKNLEKTIQPLTAELLHKYEEFIALLSKNEVKRDIDKLIQTGKVEGWSIYTQMYLFKFSLNSGKSMKKKIYDLSIIIDDTINELHSREEINLTSTPEYYGHKRIDKSFRCLETGKEIKYKGRICINSIDVDNDIYFKYGTFETRENNFLQKNKEYLGSLVTLDKKLQKVSRDYMKFLILELTSPSKKTKINLEGGL